VRILTHVQSLLSCLQTTVTVDEGLSTNWILVGAAFAAVVVVGGLVILVRRKHAHLQAIMLMLFTEVRGASMRPSSSPGSRRKHSYPEAHSHACIFTGMAVLLSAPLLPHVIESG
jgi:acid phosphatase family membrane protein YuiD